MVPAGKALTITASTPAAVKESLYPKLGDWMLRHIFVTTSSSAVASPTDITRLADVYSTDAWMEAALGTPKCHKCGVDATKRCGMCKNVWYCSRECQVGDWKTHKPLCEVVARDANT